MRFVVSRTGLYDDGTPPCEEAEPHVVAHWDRRDCASPEEFDQRVAARFREERPWLEVGTDHGYWENEDGSGIKRRLSDKGVWAIEINSLEELTAFAEKYGDLVLTTNMWDCESPEIEIYDSYRE